jgi:hypothetical protein
MSPAVTLDNTQNTEYVLSHWNGNSGGNGRLRIFTITGTVCSGSYSDDVVPECRVAVGIHAHGGVDFAPQSGATQKIQNDSRMHGVVYQNGSLWGAQSAFLPAATPTRTAVQWWQANPTTAAVQQFDGTGTNLRLPFDCRQ